MVKTTGNCINIRTAGAAGSMCKFSPTTVCSCADLSDNEDQSAIIVEYCMSTPWSPVRIDEIYIPKRLKQTGDHKDSDQLIVL